MWILTRQVLGESQNRETNHMVSDLATTALGHRNLALMHAHHVRAC